MRISFLFAMISLLSLVGCSTIPQSERPFYHPPALATKIDVGYKTEHGAAYAAYLDLQMLNKCKTWAGQIYYRPDKNDYIFTLPVTQNRDDGVSMGYVPQPGDKFVAVYENHPGCHLDERSESDESFSPDEVRFARVHHVNWYLLTPTNDWRVFLHDKSLVEWQHYGTSRGSSFASVISHDNLVTELQASLKTTTN